LEEKRGPGNCTITAQPPLFDLFREGLALVVFHLTSTSVLMIPAQGLKQ